VTTGPSVPSLDVWLPSDAYASALAADLARLVCDWLAVPAETAQEIEIGVVEAVNNAVEHAHRNCADKRVRLVLEPTPTWLVMRISDEGAALPDSVLALAPSSMEHIGGIVQGRTSCFPSNDVDLELLPQRGMGLSLMKMTMDEITYESTREGNVLTLKKHLWASARRASLPVAMP
jgi:serine/threonine-protein kinase RsbW